MALDTAYQNGSARTNLPEKLIRPGRGSELSGMMNNPRFGRKFKVMNAPDRGIVESEDSESDSYDICSDTSGLDAQISLFSSVREVEPGRATTIRDFIKDVKEGCWKEQVDDLQHLIRYGKRKEYNEKKRLLPGVALSGSCKSRASHLSAEAKAITHSGWLQADFDLKDNGHLADKEVALEVRLQLLEDPHIGAVFCGPSGEGIKAVVCINAERHKDSWFAAEIYFAQKYGLKLDKSTKDPLRLCFVSFDPLAEISQKFAPLPISELRKTDQEIWRPPVETTAADIEEMLRFIPKRPEYETWLRIASAVWSVLPMAEGCRLLAQWSPEEVDGEYATKHKHRLEQVGIGTLCHIASQHGFDARAAWKRKRWAGRIRFAEGTRTKGEDPTADPSPQGIITERDISRERVIDALRDGQVGDAKLWTEIRRGLRVWNIHAETWMIYEGGIWRRDEGRTNILDISETLCRIYDAVIESVEKEIAASPPPDAKKDARSQELKDLRARRKLLGNYDYLQSLSKLAAVALQLPATAFDTQPDLLAVENGTLDFAEGFFREHRPTDYLTHRTTIVFDPDAKCPVWDSYLDYFMSSSQELIAYLARAVGYSLTGRVHEDAMFFCHGRGANGKSTFFGGLQLLLGDLMTTVPIAALLADKSDNNYDYYKASMEGRRIVMTDEIPEGKRLAEHQIKALVGGDDIAARRPYEKPYKFRPTHKLWLMGNHKPEIRGTDHGIWRRIHLIPWMVTISEEHKRARHEVLADFSKERAGILNWAILGVLDAQALGGIHPPASVIAATKEYRAESDQFSQFLEQCTAESPQGKTKLRAILAAYKIWCEENGEPSRYGSSRKIGAYFKEAGYETKKIGHDKSSFVFGIELCSEETSPELPGVIPFRT